MTPTPADPESLDNAWSDPATWGGKVPEAGDFVEIPQGMSVMLDTTTAPLSGLAIKGELIGFDAGSIGITSDFIAVEGRLEIGTVSDPFDSQATLTLTGTDPRAVTPYSGQIGNKALGVVGTGQLELHGATAAKVSWTQIVEDARPGDTSLRTFQPVNWTPGDRIVLAPSGYDPLEAEELTVESVNGDVVSFSPPLRFLHTGTTQSYEGKLLDNRAEVGLLTRNIVVQGDDQSQLSVDPDTGFETGFGGHSIFRDDALIRIAGAEFRRMGQTGSKGRYSVHWHIAGDQSGDYVKDSSIHHSFQRAVVMHQSDNILAENNVAYHIANHAFIPSEDGNEAGNDFIKNLSVLSYSPEPEDFAFRSDTIPGASSQGEFRSSGFWMKNAGHTFRGNHVAGAYEGMGFFFDRVDALDDPLREPLVFADNLAHTVHREEEGFRLQLTYPEITRGHALMFGAFLEGEEVLAERFTAYNNFSGGWLEDRNARITDSILSDNGVGTFLLRSLIDGLVVVGRSENAFRDDKPEFGANETLFPGRSGAVHMPPAHGNIRAPVIKDLTVINEDDAAIVHNFLQIGPGSRVEKLKLVNTETPLVLGRVNPVIYDGFRHDQAFEDPLGAAAGDGQPSVFVKQRSPLVGAGCDFNRGAQGYRCLAADSYRVEFLHGSDSPDYAFADDGVEVLLSANPRGVIHMKSGNDTFSYLRDDKAYDIVWKDGHDVPATLDMEITRAADNPVQLRFEMASAPSAVRMDGTSVSRAPSLDALNGAGGSGWFHDAAARKLHVRFLSGEDSYDVAIMGQAGTNEDVAADPVGDVSTSAGLTYDVYQKGASQAPKVDLSALGPKIRSGTVAGLNRAVMNDDEDAVAVFRGYIDIREEGEHAFLSSGNPFTDVYIGGTYIGGRVPGVSEGPQPLRRLRLKPGLHELLIVQSYDPDAIRGDAVMKLHHKAPSTRGFGNSNNTPLIDDRLLRRGG